MAPSIVKRYQIAFTQYKWFGFVVVVLCLAGAGFVGITKETPETTYDARGILSYYHPPVTFSDTGELIQEQGKALTKEILQSDFVVNTAAAKVQEDPKRIRKTFSVALPKPESPPVITVYYDGSPTRERGEEIMQALLDAMISQSRLINTDRLRALITTISERLPAAEKNLDEAERRLEQYERQQGVAILAARSGSLASEIVTNQAQQAQLRMQIEGVQGQMIDLEQRLGLTVDQAYVSQALSADPIIADLRASLHQIETQISLLSQNFRSAHPQMVDLRKQQEAYNQLLENRAAEVIGGDGITAPLLSGTQIRKDSSLDPERQRLAQMLIGLSTQKESLEGQLRAMTNREEELRREYATLPNLQLEQQRLAQQVALHKQRYERMQTALSDALAAEAETVSSLAVQQVYVNSKTPPPFNAMLTLVMAGVIGTVLGGGVIFVLSLLEGKYYTMEEVKAGLQGLDLRILGILPLVHPLEPDSELMPLIVDSNSPYLSFCEQLRSNLRRLGEKRIKMLLITSVGMDEGKSFCAYNLAIASARAGKRTLIIETDLRSASACRSLKLTPDIPCLEPLRYYSDLSHCIRLAPEVEELYIIPSVGPLPNSAAILESNEMRRIIKEAAHRFDMVILDAPPLSVCNDAFLLEPLTDGMVIVTRPGYTQSSLLAEYIEPLIEQEETTILGGIINGADIPVNFAENPSEFLPEYPPTTDSLEPFEPSFDPSGADISVNGACAKRSRSQESRNESSKIA
jgi:capsular exopolysaccharide synthesis family protein